MAARELGESEYSYGREAPGTGPVRGSRTVWIIGVVVALAVGWVLGNQVLTLMALNQRAELLTSAIAQAESDNAQLQLRRDYAATDAGAEEALRELGWLREGETAIVPVPQDSSAPGRQPFQPERSGPRPSNWQRWWNWFFDSTPRR